jgi:hypothetical protein
MMKGWCTLSALLMSAWLAQAQRILIPMDERQTDHLKAYGVAYWVLTQGVDVDWLLNYRGGSFLTRDFPELERELRIRGVAYEKLTSAQAEQILAQIASEDSNMEAIRLEKAPRIAVYTPPHSLPWDDAVTLALTYAEVPYDKVWDEEVLRGKLAEYDWLHLHHEDFTGQYSRFWALYRHMPWFVRQQRDQEEMARKLGFATVPELKKAIARAIKEYVAAGGFLFAMCTATETLDIALAAEGIDIVPPELDGTPITPEAQQKLDYGKTLAFQGFQVSLNPYETEHSDIDVQPPPALQNPLADYFVLFEFSAKHDPVPTMLTQNHVNVIKGFMGQTTNFRKSRIKESVVILAEAPGRDEVRYLHGNYGRGTFTFYGGHDPEDYQHFVGDPPTDLALHKNSPGYRLILNNILFPAARKKPQKT